MNIFQAIGIPAIKKTVYVNPACFEQTPGNLARMINGKSPIGTDGLSVTLHHIGRKASSPLATLTDTFHRVHSNKIHNIDPPNGQEVDRKAFKFEKRKVWKGIAWLIENNKDSL